MQIVTIRPLRLGDVPLIDTMHDRVSKESLYSRYFTDHKPSLNSLFEQANLSSSKGSAYVAALQSPEQEIVGLAYYLSKPEDMCVAEPALLIEDRFQGQGLGKIMMECLLREAQAHCVSYFKIFVLPANQRMLRILEQSELPTEIHYCDGLFQVWQYLDNGKCIPNSACKEISTIGSELDPAVQVGL
jgi:GNAT superfamily N-acetyltransferase